MTARIDVIHRDLNVFGGGEAVCAHVLDALSGVYDVRLLTTSDPPSMAELNEYYGTDVSSVTTEVLGVGGVPLERLFGAAFDSPDYLNTAITLSFGLFHRRARQRSRSADAAINTYCAFDGAVPSLSYVHHPFMKRSATDASVFESRARAEEIVSHRVGRFSPAALDPERVFVNSPYTATVFEDVYGFDPSVLTPPVDVASVRGGPPPADRECGFVTVGRIAPDKRLLETVEIIDRLRDRGRDVHLHVVGPSSSLHAEYAARVRAAAAERTYVTFEGAVSRDRLCDLLQTHRYGIHGRPKEHFGIAVAELYAAGALPFVPEEGGPADIVEQTPALCFGDTDEAVERIDAVLTDPELERGLRASLPDPAAKFGAERFRRRIRDVVASLLEETTGV